MGDKTMCARREKKQNRGFPKLNSTRKNRLKSLQHEAFTGPEAECTKHHGGSKTKRECWGSQLHCGNNNNPRAHSVFKAEPICC